MGDKCTVKRPIMVFLNNALSQLYCGNIEIVLVEEI